VVVPMVRAAMGNDGGLVIVQQVWYTGDSRDWEAYGR